MKEINFNVEDIEKIDLSMDVGIKEIYPPLENLEVVPTKQKQIFKHENSYGYDNVTINPISDEYIIPSGTLPITENTIYDVREYAKVSASVHPTLNLQDKEVTPTKEIQTIVADEGYDGIEQVTVNPIPSDYVIPAKPTKGITIDEYDANGYPTKITFYGNTVQDYAFSNEYSGSATYISKNLQEVVFNDKVTTIGSNAFKKNPNLVSVNSLDEVTTLNANAFWGCNKLKVSRANKVKYFYTYTFSECSSLIQMSMESATNILGGNSSNGAFYKCTSLKAVWIGPGITNSGFSRYSFNGCTSMIKMFIDLPRATVETFTNYQYAFMNNANKIGIIVCNDDEGFISRAEFDAIDWSTR